MDKNIKLVELLHELIDNYGDTIINQELMYNNEFFESMCKIMNWDTEEDKEKWAYNTLIFYDVILQIRNRTNKTCQRRK